MGIKDKYVVKSIDAFQCKGWILYKHYAKRMPCIEYSFGLFCNNILNGIVCFGTPFSGNLRDSFGLEYKLMELNRLVVNDGLELNALSFFVSSSLRLLPPPMIIVSYADPQQGHNGYIYQATNFIYTGLSTKRSEWKIKGMEHLHSMTIGDKTRGKENRSEWIRNKFGDDFYLAERPRKHRYFYFLGSKKDIIKMKGNLPYPIEPYPKGENKKYDASHKPIIQQQLF